MAQSWRKSYSFNNWRRLGANLPHPRAAVSQGEREREAREPMRGERGGDLILGVFSGFVDSDSQIRSPTNKLVNLNGLPSVSERK